MAVCVVILEKGVVFFTNVFRKWYFFPLKQFSKCTYSSLLLFSVLILHSNSYVIQTMLFCSTLANRSHKVCLLFVLRGTENVFVYFSKCCNSKILFLGRGCCICFLVLSALHMLRFTGWCHRKVVFRELFFFFSWKCLSDIPVLSCCFSFSCSNDPELIYNIIY